jgi:hypothetical protein
MTTTHPPITPKRRRFWFQCRWLVSVWLTFPPGCTGIGRSHRVAVRCHSGHQRRTGGRGAGASSGRKFDGRKMAEAAKPRPASPGHISATNISANPQFPDRLSGSHFRRLRGSNDWRDPLTFTNLGDHMGQAPSRPPIFHGFRSSHSEPVPFFHSLSRKGRLLAMHVRIRSKTS